MRRRRLLARLQQGAVHNVAFADFVVLVTGLGFVFVRRVGNHRIYQRDGIPETVNLQPAGNQAKANEIRQFLKIIERYGLELDD